MQFWDKGAKSDIHEREWNTNMYGDLAKLVSLKSANQLGMLLQ